MRLSEKRIIFTHNLTLLIQHAESIGYGIALDDVKRTEYQQKKYFEEGKTKTLQSQHLKGLAADLVIYKDGEYQKNTEPYKELHEYWETLDENNSKAIPWDLNHFEMKG